MFLILNYNVEANIYNIVIIIMRNFRASNCYQVVDANLLYCSTKIQVNAYADHNFSAVFHLKFLINIHKRAYSLLSVYYFKYFLVFL